MRKLIYAIVLSLGCGSLNAHNGSTGNRYSDLNIKMWDNSSFIITLDHDITQKTRNFSLKNVSPGSHFVKIIKKKKNRNGYGGFVQKIYEGRINIPSKRKVFVKVEGRNRLSFKFFKKPKKFNHSHHSNNGHNSHNNCGSQYGSDNYFNGNGGHYNQTHFGNNGFLNSPNVMNNHNFNRLMSVIKNESFDSNRLKIAKQALAANNLRVNQVAAIMEELTFENTRLAFAKAAYNSTVDRENYFVINNKFNFSSSISNLNNYIRHNS